KVSPMGPHNVSRHRSVFSRPDPPEVCSYIVPRNRRGSRECRVHAAPAVSCAVVHKEMRTRAYRFSGGNPAFPAQWFYGLCRALPGDEFVLVTVAAGLMAIPIRLDRISHRQLGTSNGCRDHTVLPYATGVVRLARRL